MTSRARRLRSDLSEAEKLLWTLLRRNQFARLHFRRQHPIGRFVLDFYCPATKLAIELDGGQHGRTKQRQADIRRSQWLQEQGIMVVRFWNNDVLHNVEGVWDEIAVIVKDRRNTLTPSPTLPLAGGGSTGAVCNADVSNANRRV